MIVAAAIVRGHDVLAAQRAYPEALAGKWEFPGGKVEPGESPSAALHREIREELAIDIELGARLDGPDGDWPLPNGSRMRLWLARTLATPRLGPSHLQLRWQPVEALTQLDWLEGDLPILAPLVTAIGKQRA